MKRLLFGFILALTLCLDLHAAQPSAFGIEIGEPLVVSGEIGYILPFTGPLTKDYHTVPNQSIASSEALPIVNDIYNTDVIPTTTAREAVATLVFGTVAGSYTTCTMQLKTSVNGVSFQTLGAAQTVTVTTGTVNTWTIIEQAGTTSVTSGAVSATVALSFGAQSFYAFACSGSYGTSAPGTLTVIYR